MPNYLNKLEMTNTLQNLNSVMNLPTYGNVKTKLIDIKPKGFIDFPITPNLNFAEDIWNFKEFERFSGEAYAYTFDFSELDITYKNYAKYTILRDLFIQGNRFTTVKKNSIP